MHNENSFQVTRKDFNRYYKVSAVIRFLNLSEPKTILIRITTILWGLKRSLAKYFVMMTKFSSLYI